MTLNKPTMEFSRVVTNTRIDLILLIVRRGFMTLRERRTVMLGMPGAMVMIPVTTTTKSITFQLSLS